tara:strand:- start:96 stop:383 length:288 start_codon:yes stop_codon:yes gene_type:complete
MNNLNGWKPIASANLNGVVDIVDADGNRYTDCWQSKVVWHDESGAVQYSHSWCGTSDDGYGSPEKVINPLYWMKVKLPFDEPTDLTSEYFDGMKE